MPFPSLKALSSEETDAGTALLNHRAATWERGLKFDVVGAFERCAGAAEQLHRRRIEQFPIGFPLKQLVIHHDDRC